ncbi:type I methionyl aminopeptidase [Candidatus Sumerlaeota bacterium]|nr:type I methionyl aminopeptidase [Candidatus Sumerlaeota bacterium]
MAAIDHINEIIELKTAEEIELMKEAGQILREILDEVVRHVKAGVSTAELDKLAFELIKEAGCVPAFLGYRGYPATLCTSINEEVVHGIPSPERRLKEGDIISLDIGLAKNGFFADKAVTVGVGKIDDLSRRLLEVTEQALYIGINEARVGNRVGDISASIQEFVESHGFNVVREYSGHGIGRNLHEPPQVLNYGKRGSGPRLLSGMTIALEPMVNVGDWRTIRLPDKWTVVTADNLRSAHFEHTIAITDKEPLILT